MADVVGVDILVTVLKAINQNLAQLVGIANGIFPRVSGTFTCGAAATTTVTQTDIASNSIVVFIPTNAAAGTLVGSTKSPYVSTITPGASFVVSTASGGAAAGTETFSYLIVTPI